MPCKRTNRRDFSYLCVFASFASLREISFIGRRLSRAKTVFPIWRRIRSEGPAIVLTLPGSISQAWTMRSPHIKLFLTAGASTLYP